MTDDIVARLRRENDCLLPTGLDISDVLLPAAAEIERLRARVAELQAEREWRPIESAPRNGTWILVAGGSTEDEEDPRSIAVAHWTANLNGRVGPQYSRWEFARYDGGYYGYYLSPTHWLPLPPAPEAEP